MQGEYSDHIVYADESGDPNPASVDPNYPVLVLNFCVFRKDEYAASVLRAVTEFKYEYFGHDDVVLHENEIRLQRPPFSFLRDAQAQSRFMAELDKLIRGVNFTIIAAVFDKRQLDDRDFSMSDPYELAFNACVERLRSYLESAGQQEHRTHIIIESRGSKEDRQLEMAFQLVQDGANSLNKAMPEFAVQFADKKTNSAGLQIADLTARPIGRHFIDPKQPNRAWDALESKILRHGNVDRRGLTILPK